MKCSTTATELNVTWKNMIKGTFKNDTRGYQVEVRRNKEHVEVKNLNSSSHHYFLNRLGNYVNTYFPYFIPSIWKVYIIAVKIYWIIVWQRNGKIAETFLVLLTSPGSIPWPVLERSLWFVCSFFFFSSTQLLQYHRRETDRFILVNNILTFSWSNNQSYKTSLAMQFSGGTCTR